MGRFSAWSVGLFLAFLGSYAAHTLAYVSVAADPQRRGQLLEAGGHSYFAYLPFVCGLMAGLAVLGLAARVVATERRQAAVRWPISLLPALTFVAQEHVERLGHDGQFPWLAVLEPTFLTGLLLQLPLGVVAYVAARALLGSAERLGAFLRAPARRMPADRIAFRPIHVPGLVRVAARSTGRVTRGPPVRVAA
jgi:hypothetical protein